MKTHACFFFITFLMFGSTAACGSSSSSTDDGTPVTTTGGTSGNSGGGGSVSSTCDMSYKCGTVISSPGGDSSKLCSSSVAFAKLGALGGCACGSKCAAKCGDNLCTQQQPSSDCQVCLMDSVTGCGVEFADCAAN